jgi:hypothetical protein
MMNDERTRMSELTPQEQELLELFTERLPRLLEDHPTLEPLIYRAFMKVFVGKEEFAALARIVEEFREETRENFARTHARVGQVDARVERVEQRLDDFQAETRENFARVDKRFEQVDARFEQVDARFEQVDARFEQVDARFEQVDARFEQVDARFNSLETEMRRGFKEMLRHIDKLGARWGIRNEELFRETMASVLEKSFGVKVETRSIQGEQFDLIISNGEHILVEIAAGAKRNALERLERKRQLYVQGTGVTPARFIFAVAVINDRRAQLLREAGFEVIVPDDEAEDEAEG